MDLDSYQREALKTDQVPIASDPAAAAVGLIVPLLGLAGETGQLLSEYKKHLRDGPAYLLFKERVAEELGDLLWYVSNVASKFDLRLEDVARTNLEKVQGRWGSRPSAAHVFDESFPDRERLPRRFEVELAEVAVGESVRVRVLLDGVQIGADLTDNAYDPDGYRFHDVFHFAFAAVLGWSPVTRAILKRKRKSDPAKDEVEDGGRAAVIDEGVAALIFDYARHHGFLEGVTDLDYNLLRTVKSVTSHLEVSACSIGDWQSAILQGYAAWRRIVANHGGRVLIDMDARRISFVAPAN
jgi:NTP pyrophosphatase (non-canonical NTP hydrolase)